MTSSLASELLPTVPSGSVAERKSLTRRTGPCVNVNSRGSANVPDGRSIRSNFIPGERLMSTLTAPGSQLSAAAAGSRVASWRGTKGAAVVALVPSLRRSAKAATRVRVVAIDQFIDARNGKLTADASMDCLRNVFATCRDDSTSGGGIVRCEGSCRVTRSDTTAPWIGDHRRRSTSLPNPAPHGHPTHTAC